LASRALLLQAQGDTKRALSTLARALRLAEPEGYVRTFVDEGAPMARLLYQAADRGIAPEYVGRLLAAFELEEGEHAVQEASQPPAGTMVEPLTDREIEVLELVAEGLTNREVAQRLVLSVSTVKVHTYNIYTKLDVHNRTQAVSKARALGILSQ
jgi:LuxR family maltose regulon positive regulatory protein